MEVGRAHHETRFDVTDEDCAAFAIAKRRAVDLVSSLAMEIGDYLAGSCR